MSKLIQGLHYFGRNHRIFLQMNHSYFWKLTKQTKDLPHADVPGLLDKVQCNRKGNTETSTTVLVILHIIPPYSTKIVTHLKKIGHPIKSVLRGNPRSKAKQKITKILKQAFIINLKLNKRYPKINQNLHYIECIPNNSNFYLYHYIYNNGREHIFKIKRS